METQEHYRVVKGPNSLKNIARLADLLAGNRRNVTFYLEQETGTEPVAVEGILAGFVIRDARVHPTCMLADITVYRTDTWPLEIKGYNIAAGKGGIIIVGKGWTLIHGAKRYDGDGTDPMAYDGI